MWVFLGLCFVSRGLEFHQQLRTDSFEFQSDSEGVEYVTLTHEYQQNFQGGLSKEEAPQDSRMYATGEHNCPVSLLRLMLSKTAPTAEFLFNSCNKEALVSPAANNVWFGNTPLSKRTFSNFMADICKSSGTSMSYTANSLRATAFQHSFGLYPL